MPTTARDPSAVLATFRPDFVAFVERRIRDRSLAEDLVQEALAHALPRLDALRDESAVLGWFYRSLRNAIVSRHRRDRTETQALAELSRELDDRIEEEEAPSNVCRCVLTVARELKPEYADAIARIEVDGAPVKTFAEERGISNSNAAVRVFRAREALRRGLVATCGACAAAGCIDCTCSSAR